MSDSLESSGRQKNPLAAEVKEALSEVEAGPGEVGEECSICCDGFEAACVL